MRMMQDKFEVFLASLRAGTLTDDERAEFADEVAAMRTAEDRLIGGLAFGVQSIRDGDFYGAQADMEKRLHEAMAGFVATFKRGNA